MMNYGDIYLILFLSFILSTLAHGQDKVSISLKQIPDHPRIMLLKGEEELIRRSVVVDPVFKKIHQSILAECDRIIDKPPVQRIQIGRRLLDKSRECLRRVFYLSYAYRMTGQEKYFLRAEKEMLAVSMFSDWNPSHFLDVAEMTMGVAIGYDWLYGKLSPQSKNIIREAILKKGLESSFDEKYNSFLTSAHNWNQVCNAGMTYGALAISEDTPDISKEIIERAISTISLPMKEYEPDGAYPEGYNYWDYGTSFNIMFLSAIEKAFSTDFDLLKISSFLKTSGFFLHMTGVTGACYNWGDSGQEERLSPALWWFAQRNNDPSVLWTVRKYLMEEDYSKFTDERLLPAIMVWGMDIRIDKITEPSRMVWMGQGSNPVCLMRTSWTDPHAIYLGFKTGSASVDHGHMDIGSFIMEADGVRWASDFGRQDYESLESKGIVLFGRTQDAQRWTVFRLNNFAHNTLTINNKLQLVKGYAKIDKYSDHPEFSFAVSDLSSVYEDQIVSVKRGVGIVDKKYVVIRDEFQAGSERDTVRWTMLTFADAEITGKNTITLTKDGKKLFLHVSTTSSVTMKKWSTQSNKDYDAPNPGTVLVGFTWILQANQKETVNVFLIPERSEHEPIQCNRTLDQW